MSDQPRPRSFPAFLLAPRLAEVFLFVVLLVSGCAVAGYTYVDAVKSGEIIEKNLYTVAVPPISVFDEARATGIRWERFSKDGAPDDLVLKQGYHHTSYAASVEVKRKLTRLATLEDLKTYVVDELKLTDPVALKMKQDHLLCVTPAIYVDAALSRPVGFFMHAMSCIDRHTHHYYELQISQMTKRKGDTPLPALEHGALQFFSSFTVK